MFFEAVKITARGNGYQNGISKTYNQSIINLTVVVPNKNDI